MRIADKKRVTPLARPGSERRFLDEARSELLNGTWRNSRLDGAGGKPQASGGDGCREARDKS